MLEAKVLKLLKGDALNENEELCDFTLADQNEACGNFHYNNLIVFDIVLIVLTIDQVDTLAFISITKCFHCIIGHF